MATRRSRLQVKPNIGGLKGPAKAARKTAVGAKDKVEIKEKSGDKLSDNSAEISENKEVQEKEHGKDKEESPDKKEDKVFTIKTVEPKGSDSSKLEIIKSNETNNLAVEAAEGKNSNVDSGKTGEIKECEKDAETDKANDKFEKRNSVLPRARLRKFGKVNLSAARGPVSENVKKSDGKDVTKGEETVGNNGTKAPSEIKIKVTDTNANSKVMGGGDQNDKKESKVQPSVTRRARFPKAKPNVLEAGKRRQKSEDSSVGKPSVPSITVTPAPDSNEISSTADTASSVCQPSTATQPAQPTPMAGTTASSGVQPDEAKSSQSAVHPPPSTDGGGTKVPHFPRSPMKAPVVPSILASPLKQGAATGDHKRGRTVSVSEPAVPKKPKRTKIDVPCDQPPDRTTMRMRDLIYWTPSSNPMKPKVADPVKTDSGEKENVGDKPTKAEAPTGGGADEGDDLPVPQVTIGPDGNIIVNEKSLVLDNPNKDNIALLSEVVDETDKYTTYTSFKKRCYSKKWTDKETTKFYKALAMLGTDFFMMSKVFPNRDRVDLKKKFKMEDKRNRHLIERVMRERIAFDEAIFKAEDSPDEAVKKEKPKPRERRVIKRKPKKEKLEKEKTEKSETRPKIVKSGKKRVRKKFNYYEDSWSEDEPEAAAKPAKSDSTWQPPNVSQKDGEVVGILMDMSEGRLPTVGHLAEPSQPQTIQFGASQPQIILTGSNQPYIILSGSSQPQIIQSGSSQPQIIQSGSCQSQIIQSGSSQPQIILSGSSQPQIIQSGSSQPQIIQSGSSQPQIIQSGSSQPQIIQSGSSHPQIFLSSHVQPQTIQSVASQSRTIQSVASQSRTIQSVDSQPQIIQYSGSPSGRCSRTSRSSVDRSHSNTPDIQMQSDDYFNPLSPEMYIARPLEGVRVDTGVDDTDMDYVPETEHSETESTTSMSTSVFSVNEPIQSQAPVHYPMKLPLQIDLNPEEPLPPRQTVTVPNVTHSVASIIGDSSIPVSKKQLNPDASAATSAAAVFNTNPLTASAFASHTVTPASSHNQYLPVTTAVGLTTTNSAHNLSIESSPYSISSLLASSSVSSCVESSVQQSSSVSHSVSNTTDSSSENSSNNTAGIPMEVHQSPSSVSHSVLLNTTDSNNENTSNNTGDTVTIEVYQSPSSTPRQTPSPSQSNVSESAMEGVERVTSETQGISMVPSQTQGVSMIPSETQDVSMIPAQAQGAPLGPGQAQLVGVPREDGEVDQYVLVSMVPETGEETVIHVYRFHGGIE